MNSITLSKKITMKKKYDVIVCGGARGLSRDKGADGGG